MTKKSEYLVDLIFKKLKNFKSREIFLEKENLRKFIFSLIKKKTMFAPMHRYLDFIFSKIAFFAII